MSALLECIINQLVHPLLAHNLPASTPRVLDKKRLLSSGKECTFIFFFFTKNRSVFHDVALAYWSFKTGPLSYLFPCECLCACLMDRGVVFCVLNLILSLPLCLSCLCKTPTGSQNTPSSSFRLFKPPLMRLCRESLCSQLLQKLAAVPQADV